jgi:hypothetical protein
MALLGALIEMKDAFQTRVDLSYLFFTRNEAGLDRLENTARFRDTDWKLTL